MIKAKRYKLVVGFITYGKLTAKYLPYFLPSLANQTYRDFKILAADNSRPEDKANLRYLEKNNDLDIVLERAGKNLGFARAYNRLIARALADKAEYFLALNPDMVLAPDFIEKIITAREKNNQAGALAPKILKWDFENNKKTNRIDSYGLYITPEHRFSDLGQGQIDRLGKEPTHIFGFTGAAVLFNLEALRDVAFYNGKHYEYFDELMFMYKEDCDLSYRLRLAGWDIVFVPAAVAYHDRAVSPAGETNLKIALNRRNKNKQVKKWSYLNQLVLILKYWRLPFSLPVRLATAWYQFKSLIFIILFEQYLLQELAKLRKLRAAIKKRREQLKIRADIKEIEKFMINSKQTTDDRRQ